MPSIIEKKQIPQIITYIKKFPRPRLTNTFKAQSHVLFLKYACIRRSLKKFKSLIGAKYKE